MTDRNCLRRLARGTLEVTTVGPQHAVQLQGPRSPFKLPQCVVLDAQNRVYVADTCVLPTDSRERSRAVHVLPTAHGCIVRFLCACAILFCLSAQNVCIHLLVLTLVDLRCLCLLTHFHFYKNSCAFRCRYNNRIRRLDSDGTATIVAGTGERALRDGPGETACFDRPRAAVLDANGDILIADSLNHMIRRLCVRTGAVSTVAGTGVEGYADGASNAAQFSEPSGVAVDGEGNILVADRGNGLVRMITPSGEVITVAGRGGRTAQWEDPGLAGFRDATGPHATFSRPTGIAVDEYVKCHFPR
jgi:hypothetical protein